jgi:hypothetical protein
VWGGGTCCGVGVAGLGVVNVLMQLRKVCVGCFLGVGVGWGDMQWRWCCWCKGGSVYTVGAAGVWVINLLMQLCKVGRE